MQYTVYLQRQLELGLIAPIISMMSEKMVRSGKIYTWYSYRYCLSDKESEEESEEFELHFDNVHDRDFEGLRGEEVVPDNLNV